MEDDFLEATKRAEDRQQELARRAREVENRKTALHKDLNKANQTRNKIYLALLILGFLLVAVFLYALVKSSFADTTLLVFFFSVALFAVSTVWAVSSSRSRSRRMKDELQETQFEEELLRSGASAEEGRAEELLRMHQYQLRRYYDLNLRQNSWIFAIGILCIALGVAVIASTFLMISRSSAEWQTKAVVGFVGAIGALMINYIAAVYLRMNSAITTTLTTFHLSLAATHQLFLANLLVSRIAEPEQRWNALVQLSLAITQFDPAKASTSAAPNTPRARGRKRKMKVNEDSSEDASEV